MPGLGPYSYLQRLLVGRPQTSWRVQPFTISDNNEHTLVPAVAGLSHIITDIIAVGYDDSRLILEISGSGGVEVMTINTHYEMTPLQGLKTPIVMPVGEAIVCQRTVGAANIAIVLLGYTDSVEVPQTVYTGV